MAPFRGRGERGAIVDWLNRCLVTASHSPNYLCQLYETFLYLVCDNFSLMKKNFFFLVFISASFIMHCAFSQNPLVKMWDKGYGSPGRDGFTSFEADVHALPPGMYWLEIISGDKIFRTKFIKSAFR
jgi:hypothetical protein